MSNCVAELDSLLQSMQELKPPGVSGPKINQITTLCTANIKVGSLCVPSRSLGKVLISRLRRMRLF